MTPYVSAVAEVGAAAAPALAELHACAFAAPRDANRRDAARRDAAAWDAAAFAGLLAQTGVFALAAGSEGFILCRVAADEAEILTLAVRPEARRGGRGRALVEAARETARLRGAERLFLEVAEDNTAARTLYARTGFIEVGRRRAYYPRPDGTAADALVLAL